MSSDSRHHIRVKMVNDVAVVGFADMDVVFQPKHVQDLNDELHRLVEDEKRNKVLLNLSGIQYLSSSMLVRLININKLIEHSQGQLKLCCLSPVMLDTFRVSKLEHLFETFDDEATALARFK
jgi:anti-sigma B factor antagonist